ncbi:MAG: nucleotidyltransferase domain-containing protein [Thermovirgaceae bacterium]|nr:nucleotidyltransferase domain-containing protein [Thermovirgaceae bacterium]
MKFFFSKKEIEELCQHWDIVELSFFGSVLRDDFREDSDVDVMVSFSPSAEYGLFALSRLKEELESIFGRKVDLVDRAAVENSRNFIRRKEILESRETVYAA